MAESGPAGPGPRVTYTILQRWVRQHHGFSPLPAWIAHVKALAGLEPRRAANRRGERRTLCPADKQPAIVAALQHFGVISRPPTGPQ
jgi:hypothetical protein